MEIHNTHIPPGSTNGWIKMQMLEEMHSGIAARTLVSRILCGDFNTPQHETESGDIFTCRNEGRAVYGACARSA